VDSSRETRKARIEAHRAFDQIWKRRLVRRRSDAYSWMRLVMGLTHNQAHLSQFTVEQCDKLTSLVYRDYPKLRTRFSRLLYGDEIEE